MSEEGSFPDSADNIDNQERNTLIKQAALWLRIDGLLERSQMAARHLAALIMKMENRIPRGPPDYQMGPAPGVYIDYGDRRPPSQEPSWQNSLLGKIVAPLIVLGIPAILVTLWNISSRMATMEADRSAQEKHLEAHDKMLDEIERELWPHKH